MAVEESPKVLLDEGALEGDTDLPGWCLELPVDMWNGCSLEVMYLFNSVMLRAM